MSEITIYLPKLGESIVSATIVKWFKHEGDRVELDEPLLEVSTDKVNSEIPSSVAGTMVKILAKVDEELKVGAPLAIISTEAIVHIKKTERIEEKNEIASLESQDLISPAVLKMAQENKIPFDELKSIPTSSESGRLSKKDLQNYINNKVSSKKEEVHCKHQDKIKMTGMRKAIAENMVKSFYQAPHASLIHEVDVTEAYRFMEKNKEMFLKEHGAKLTITAFIALAIAKAAKSFPLLNSSLDEDTIIVKKEINLGIAVSVEQGIMVPVIKGAHEMDLIAISKAISNLANRVHSNTLKPDEVKEGTITMTNFGMGGVMLGIPIIRFPEVAIVGVGAVKKKVVVLEDDSMAIRKMVHLCLTFDHRVIDGMYGCSFLQEVQNNLKKML